MNEILAEERCVKGPAADLRPDHAFGRIARFSRRKDRDRGEFSVGVDLGEPVVLVDLVLRLEVHSKGSFGWGMNNATLAHGSKGCARDIQ